jgi:outer membrane lipoprotein-sorting protein
VPKGNASFKYAEIWVDSSGMPVQTKIVEKNDDATTMRLSGVERNLKISSDEFSIKLDPSVKIVKG